MARQRQRELNRLKYVEMSQQVGIELKTNLRIHFGKHGGFKLEYFRVVKSTKNIIIH